MGIAQNWRVRNQRYALVGEVCNDCGKKIFPPRDVCPYCTEPAQTPFQFSGQGEVFSHTTIYNPPVFQHTVSSRGLGRHVLPTTDYCLVQSNRNTVYVFLVI